MAGTDCWRVKVDYEVCSGHGVCEMVAPDIFRLDDDGVSTILKETVGEDRRDDLLMALKRCPEGAIVAEKLEEIG